MGNLSALRPPDLISHLYDMKYEQIMTPVANKWGHYDESDLVI